MTDETQRKFEILYNIRLKGKMQKTISFSASKPIFEKEKKSLLQR